MTDQPATNPRAAAIWDAYRAAVEAGARTLATVTGCEWDQPPFNLTDINTWQRHLRHETIRILQAVTSAGGHPTVEAVLHTIATAPMPHPAPHSELLDKDTIAPGLAHAAHLLRHAVGEAHPDADIPNPLAHIVAKQCCRGEVAAFAGGMAAALEKAAGYELAAAYTAHAHIGEDPQQMDTDTTTQTEVVEPGPAVPQADTNPPTDADDFEKIRPALTAAFAADDRGECLRLLAEHAEPAVHTGEAGDIELALFALFAAAATAWPLLTDTTDPASPADRVVVATAALAMTFTAELLDDDN